MKIGNIKIKTLNKLYEAIILNFNRPLFLINLILIFIDICLFIFITPSFLDIDPKDTFSIIANALTTLFATFISITIPLIVASKISQDQRSSEAKNAYITIALYVGVELIDNKILIQEVLLSNKAVLDNEEQTERKYLLRIKAALWLEISRDLLRSLSDEYHKEMIVSGILLKVPDDSIRSDIRLAYSQYSLLIRNLNRLNSFFDSMLNPNKGVEQSAVEAQLEKSVDHTIKSVEDLIQTYISTVDNTCSKINNYLKVYGLKIEPSFNQKN